MLFFFYYILFALLVWYVCIAEVFLDHKTPDTNLNPAIFEMFSLGFEAKLKLLIYCFHEPIRTRLTYGNP